MLILLPKRFESASNLPRLVTHIWEAASVGRLIQSDLDVGLQEAFTLEILTARFPEYFSVVKFAAALAMAPLLAWVHRDRPGGSYLEQLFRWLLLLSPGVWAAYTFVADTFFTSYWAEHMGWAVILFQYEVGIADLTVAIIGLVTCWSNFGFRVAAALAGIVWRNVDAIGHVGQMIVANNYAPGNAGPWFWIDGLAPVRS